MPNIYTIKLMDKDIRNLEIKQKEYKKVVGEPKELYIFVSPKGKKTFALIHKKYNKQKTLRLNEYRAGIYSVAEARKESIIKLKELLSKTSTEQKTLNELSDLYLDKKMKDTRAKDKNSEIRRIRSRLERTILPKYGKAYIDDIDHLELNRDFITLNKDTSTDVLLRVLSTLRQIGDLAVNLGYANKNIFNTIKLNLILPKQRKKHYPCVKTIEEVKKLIQDIKHMNCKKGTKIAIYMCMLSVQRAGSIISAKWSDIDLQNKIWVIRSEDMKTKDDNLIDEVHKVPLSPTLIKLLEIQYLRTCNKEFVFSSLDSKSRHISTNTLSKLLNDKGYRNKFVPHSFRILFSTFCYENRTELLKLNIDLNMIELIQAHKIAQNSGVAGIYNRSHNLEQKAKLLNWYDNFLNEIEKIV